MAQIGLGEFLALVGMIVLLITGMGRRSLRQGRLASGRRLAGWVGYGDYVACGLILAGLVVMYLKK